MNPSTLYQKFVARKFAYRVIPASHLATIKKHGIVFGKDPYKRFHDDIRALFTIVLRLEKRGFHMMRWWGQPTPASKVIETTLRDIEKQFIDFTLIQHHVRYYRKLRGGALITTIHLFAHELLAKGVPLASEEHLLCRRVLRNTEKLKKQHMVVLRVSSEQSIFERAVFQTADKKKLPSPFGSKEHFEKTIAKRGWESYEPYLTGKTQFYLRVRESVPARFIR